MLFVVVLFFPAVVTDIVKKSGNGHENLCLYLQYGKVLKKIISQTAKRKTKRKRGHRERECKSERETVIIFYYMRTRSISFQFNKNERASVRACEYINI